MWKEMFEEEIKELKELGVHTKRVKCGEFYSIAQVINFYKKYKDAIQEINNGLNRKNKSDNKTNS